MERLIHFQIKIPLILLKSAQGLNDQAACFQAEIWF
jgi:hypothetical protein